MTLSKAVVWELSKCCMYCTWFLHISVISCDGGNGSMYIGIEIIAVLLFNQSVSQLCAFSSKTWTEALGDSTASRQCSASCTGFHFSNSSTSRSLPFSTRRRLGTLPATWLTTAASLPMPSQEDSIWLTLVRFSSVRCRPTLVTELSVLLEQSAHGPRTAGFVIQLF